MPQDVSSARFEQKKVIFRTYQVIWYIVGVMETFLLFRFIFKLAGANPISPFVQFVYAVAGFFLAPFRGIFPVLAEGQFIFEWPVLVAMAVYWVIAYGLVYLFQLIKPVDPDEVESHVDNP